MKKAVIEIGTNSIKFCMAEGYTGGEITLIKDINEITKLGEGLNLTGKIGKEGMERSLRSVLAFVKEALRDEVDEISVVGTMALRTAENTQTFAEKIKELTGLKINIISGEEEALLSFFGAISGLPAVEYRNIVTFDTGGGSTDFVFAERGNIKSRVSLNIGAISLTERYFKQVPVPPETLVIVQNEIHRELREGGITSNGGILIGMGGNVTTMAAVKIKMKPFVSHKIQGLNLTISDVKNQIADYASKAIYERSRIAGLDPGRADIILAGACIVNAVMELCNVYEIIVSNKGLRHILIHKMFEYPFSEN